MNDRHKGPLGAKYIYIFPTLAPFDIVIGNVEPEQYQLEEIYSRAPAISNEIIKIKNDM